MSKTSVTHNNLEDALWFPEDYNWHSTEPRPTEGGGTAVWDPDQQSYVFVTPPDWWTDCKSGDAVPEEWGMA